MNRDEIIDATRAFIRSELLHDEAASLGPDEPLLSGGIITSFDLVSLTVFLERRFGVKVPDAKVSRDFLDTLDQIAALVLSLQGSEPVGSATMAEPPSNRYLPSFRHRPLLVLATALLLMIGFDRAVGALVEDRATLDRIEAPDHRRMSYVYQSYERALWRHDLAMTPKGPDEIRIVFQGDSGTYGSYLEADEACPAVLGRLLAAQEPRARVYNVSYFGQTFVKDAEMLEVALPRRPDLVVVSLCSTHLSRERQRDWWLTPPTTIVYNRPLFTRFLEELPPGVDRGKLDELAAVLARSEKTHGMDLLHRVERWSAIARNQLFLRSCVVSIGTPSFLEPVMRARNGWLDPKSCRYLHGKTTADVVKDQPYTLDEGSLALLEAVIDRARAADAEVALFWEPEPRIQGSPPSRIPWNEAGWSAARRAVQGVVDRKGVLLVDGLDLLGQDEFLDSERHWTAEGNAKIGELLAEKLAPLVAKLAKEHR